MNLAFPQKRIALYAIAIVGLVGARGHLFAQVLEGRYRWEDWVIDSAAFGLLILAIKLIDAGIQVILRRCFPPHRTGRQGLAVAFRVIFLILAVFPFLLATLQIHPQRVATRGTPADWDLPYEDVIIDSRGRHLRGWYCPQANPRSTIFVAHGLNANRENFLAPVRILHDLGHAVLIIDFPAHGDSPGRSTTLGLAEAEDVKAAHDWLAARHPDLAPHALGYSMGAAAVLTATARYGVFDRIAVDGTFSSARRVADATVLRFTGPLRNIVWNMGRFWIQLWTGADLNQHEPIEAVRDIPPGHLLIIHGTADRVIPIEEGRALHRASANTARFIEVDGYGHAETIQHPEYAAWLDGFFKP